MKPDVIQTVTGVLRREEIENEKKIHLVRMGVLSLAIVVVTAARLLIGAKMHERFLATVPLAVCYLLLCVIIWYSFIRRGCPPLVGYLIAVLDMVYVVAVLMGLAATNLSGDRFIGVTNMPAFLALFLLNALSGLRFNFRTSIYYAATSILIVLALGAYDAFHGFFPYLPSGILETLIKAILLGGIALISGYIGHRLKQLIVQAVKEQEEKNLIRGIFGRYASDEVVEDALRRGLQLGGEEREVTILFADIRNFTSLAERLQPNEVVNLLNDYFAQMVDVITRNSGTLNKFMGDGMLAIFGAPVSYGNNAERAVKTALAMVDRLEQFNGRQREQGKTELKIGIGISSGCVVVGHIGSIERMEYTAIGDAVNVAARLDTLNKELGTTILICHDTYQRVGEGIRVRELKSVVVKGKGEEVQVYEVLGDQRPA